MAKRKVKVVKAPGKGRRVGDQMGYGLYRGQSVRDFNAFTETDPHADMRNMFPEVPRSQANIEVEKGEKIIAKDGMSIYDVGGKKHSQGGTPVKAEPGSYVVSDYIKAPKFMQAKMGFEVQSNKAKDNTWARVLESKVSTKDYNKLAEFLRQAAAGGDIDRFELATAKNKMAVYQDYVSKAALGNELTKMMQGKEYKIPEIGIPALQKMFPEMAQKMMGGGGAPNPGGPEPNGVQEYPQGQEPMMAYGGEYYNLPKALTGTEAEGYEDLLPWLRGKTRAGSYTPTGISNAYNRNEAFLQSWADTLGMDINALKKMSNRDVQGLIYDWSLKNNPEAINQMWKTYGLTNLGRKYKDLVGMTAKDAKGRPTYTFDKDLNPQQLSALRKAYIDNMFGRRQLDPLNVPNIKIPSDDSFIPPPEEETPPGETPAEGGTKWFCDSVTGNVTPVPANMANNAPGSSITYYNSKEEAAAACGKKGDIPPTKEIPPIKGVPPQDIPRLPYEQDVINLGTSLVNKYGYRDVYPFRAKARLAGWDPAFFSTAAQEALLNSQAKAAMEDASLYAGSPQVQAARQQQAQQASIPALMQARMQTNQANIGQDTQARMANAAISNQEALYNNQIANQLMDMNAKFIHNKDVSRAKSNVDVANQLNAMLTHSGDTYLMNQWYPQEAFNPLTYRTYFHSGKGIKDEAAPTEADFGTDYNTAVQMAKAQGLTSPKDIHDAAMDIIEYKRGRVSTRNNRRPNPYSTTSQNGYSDPYASSTESTTGYEQGGTFVPVYFVGGLW